VSLRCQLEFKLIAGAGGGLGAIAGVAIADSFTRGLPAQAIVALCAGLVGLIGYYVGQQLQSG
jgi:hypothetical protein